MVFIVCSASFRRSYAEIVVQRPLRVRTCTTHTGFMRPPLCAAALGHRRVRSFSSPHFGERLARLVELRMVLARLAIAVRPEVSARVVEPTHCCRDNAFLCGSMAVRCAHRSHAATARAKASASLVVVLQAGAEICFSSDHPKGFRARNHFSAARMI